MFEKIINSFSLSNIWENDGILISIIGYIVVFAALLFLYLFILSFTKTLASRQRKKLRAIGHKAAEEKDLNISGEINAAISMALYLYFQEIHDYESAVITIKQTQKPYSPWSSKIYGIKGLSKR